MKALNFSWHDKVVHLKSAILLFGDVEKPNFEGIGSERPIKTLFHSTYCANFKFWTWNYQFWSDSARQGTNRDLDWCIGSMPPPPPSPIFQLMTRRRFCFYFYKNSREQLPSAQWCGFQISKRHQQTPLLTPILKNSDKFRKLYFLALLGEIGGNIPKRVLLFMFGYFYVWDFFLNFLFSMQKWNFGNVIQIYVQI